MSWGSGLRPSHNILRLPPDRPKPAAAGETRLDCSWYQL